jgi:hypothetical protein
MKENMDVEIKQWELIESLLLRVMAQQAVLVALTLEKDDWRGRVERAVILHEPLLHEHFASLREELYGISKQAPRSMDWNSIVDRMIADNDS